jgi:hypothetical protein
MATTTNFGWDTPDDTDLVKDGALAIRTLGSSIDTSFVDLKGGTTGQVLSKASNTDLDYTWVTTDDANAIQNAIVDAKGDLIAASAADTPARLAVGNNGETLVADSAATTGLRYQGSQAAGKNYIINGGFDVWQRATSATFTPTSGTPQYNSVDRFWFAGSGTTGSCTASRQTADTTNLNYGLRFGRASGTTQTAVLYIGTNIESQQMKLLAGKAIVLSFYAKKGADFSYTPTVRLYSGTGTDQSPGTLFAGTWTGGADVVNTTFSPTTTMTRYTFTGTVPTTSNELSFFINWTPSGTAGGNEWLQIEGVQLEIGSVATEFQRSGGTLQGELAACQRYYYLHAESTSQSIGIGTYYNGSTLLTLMQLPVTMRTTPTVENVSGTNYYQVIRNDGTDDFNAFTSLSRASNKALTLDCTSNISGTAGQAGIVMTNNASAKLAFTAEL